LPRPPPAGAAGDLSRFLEAFARRYFSTVLAALKRDDPHHLYMGCRFGTHTPEAERAAGEVCDVVSYNIYRPRIDPKVWASLNSLGKPCLIGEFHFGALDRGMFSAGMVAAPDQAGRARMYQEYVNSVL